MTTRKTPADPAGLTAAQAQTLQKQFGKNEPVPPKKKSILREIGKTLSEPMFLLLLAAAIIYFFLGEPRDGAVMLFSVIAVIGIDVMQEWRTDRTLEALKDLSAPRADVIRDGRETSVNSADLVPGDLMRLAEGAKIPADGEIVRANDLCVDESSLTGEAQGVWKTAADGAEARPTDVWRRDWCYAGTLVTQGSALVRVTAIGAETEYGKIGAHVAAAPETRTPLQAQTGRLVKLCTGIAAVLFVLVGCATWLNIPDHRFWDRLIESVLSGVTLAMAMIPEEFPVILTVFLSLGAWRLAKRHALVRRLPAVETLGAVSVLCVDKTGTITMNRMSVRETWAADGDEAHLAAIMGMACETQAYDPMEQAMLAHCDRLGLTREALFSGELATEYPFTNETKRMGHVWKRGGRTVVAAKGSPETLLALCALTEDEAASARARIEELSRQGLRVIAVGEQVLSDGEEIPPALEACRLRLCGLAGLSDPPKEGVKEDIRRCVRAGIRIVMITGDNGETAGAIAKQIGMPNAGRIVTGDALERMSDEELREQVRTASIFSRVVPAHKMRIVRALRANGEVAAMTGDGVNDAPALKYADIGIAMGKRGSEVSREAADLILLDDRFTTIVDTIRDGRRIYTNIRAAVGYVFTIHIPIAFSCLLAPMLGIDPANLFLLPLHVVLLELVIDPTCSVVLERRPAERDVMERAPRDPGEPIIGAKGLLKSVLQGLAVFAASFGTYAAVLRAGGQPDAPLARAMGLSILFLSNLLLVLVNSSGRDSVLRTVRRLRKDPVLWATAAGTIAGLALLLYTPAAGVLKLAPLSGPQVLAVFGISAAAVLWYELVKCFLRRR